VVARDQRDSNTADLLHDADVMLQDIVIVCCMGSYCPSEENSSLLVSTGAFSAGGLWPLKCGNRDTYGRRRSHHGAYLTNAQSEDGIFPSRIAQSSLRRGGRLKYRPLHLARANSVDRLGLEHAALRVVGGMCLAAKVPIERWHRPFKNFLANFDQAPNIGF
jgi:hypothetical protein